jgi:hypothetical protein
LRYLASVSATSTPDVQQLAEELAKRLGDEPMTAKDLAVKLVAADAPVELLQVIEDALSLAATSPEDAQLDEDVWGPPPTVEQLGEATAIGRGAVSDALRGALEEALTRDEAAQRLGITPQAVSKRLAAGSLVSLRRGRVRWLPAWQFHADGVLPALGDLIAAYPGDALALTSWVTTPSPDLGGATPAQALTRRGGPQAVLEAVAALTPAAW